MDLAILKGSLWDLKFRKMIVFPVSQRWKLFWPTVPGRKSGGSQGHRTIVIDPGSGDFERERLELTYAKHLTIRNSYSTFNTYWLNNCK